MSKNDDKSAPACDSSMKQYLDITSIIREITSAGFSIRNICKLITVLSLDEMRYYFARLFNKLVKYISIDTVFKIIEFINKMISKYHARKQIKYLDSIPMQVCVDNSLNVAVESTLQFIESIFNYIHNNPTTCTWDIMDNYNFKIESLEDVIIKNTLYNVNITYNSLKIAVKNTMEIEYINSGNKLIVKGSKNHIELSKKEPRCICDLIPDIYKNDFTKLIHNTLLSIKSFDATAVVDDTKEIPIVAGFIYTHQGSVYSVPQNNTHIDLFNKFKLFKFNSVFILTELHILLQSLEIYTSTIKTDVNHTVNMFNKSFSVQKYGGNGCYLENLFKPVGDPENTRRLIISDQYVKMMKPLKKFINIASPDSEPSSTTTVDTSSISLHLQSDIYSKEQMLEVFDKFIKSEIQIKQTTNKYIKIFSIKLENVEEKILIDNPEYADFEEKKALLSRSNPLMRDNVSTECILNLKVPPKQINKISDIKKITEEFIADRYKNSKNLFLREKDKSYLYSVLHQFKNNKDVFEELDLQYKLNIMLYGTAGCGKSTTVIAIASLLQRDIYYISLNNINTNEDLKLLLDHVNKNCKGIVVIEDIDVQTDIVKKRKHVSDYRECDIGDTLKHKLTLDFFLNYLQGSLTKDNSVFIMTTQFKDDLDDALIRPMRMDCIIEFKMCDHYQIKQIFKQFIGRDIKDTILNKIEENRWTPSDIIAIVRNYISNGSVDDEEILKPFFFY